MKWENRGQLPPGTFRVVLGLLIVLGGLAYLAGRVG